MRVCHYRRGGMYVAVLMIATVVLVLGFSGLYATRIQLRAAGQANDVVAARFYAQSAIELALLAINNDSSWRSTHTHDTWVNEQPIGDGAYSWKLVDESKGNLTIDSTSPVRLYGRGLAGDAIRIYSVLLDPGDSSSINNLLTSGDMEDELLTGWVEFGDCDLNPIIKDNPHGGAYHMQVNNRDDYLAGPRQDVARWLTNNTTYNTEVWVRMKDYSEQARIVIWMKTGFSWHCTDVAEADVGNNWTKISGTFTTSWMTPPSEAYWKIETEWSRQEFMVDDAVLSESSAEGTPVIPIPGTFRREVTSP